MQLAFLIVFSFILLRCGKCEQTPWFSSIFESAVHQTTQLTNYILERGRSLKNDYVQNVQDKFTSYLGVGTKTDAEYMDALEDKQISAKQKCHDYIAGKEAADNMTLDTTTPKEGLYNCTDDDPTIHFTTPQLIELHGYSSESHTIVTDDGYILTVHRIPYSKNVSHKVVSRKTVLLYHSLLGSSADWVISGPQKGLAYVLSEAGYDVWLANARGNTYSRAHVSLSVDSYAFWNFTFHDVSQHDVPAVIDHIVEVKERDVEINFIGHSMGSTILFALLSTKTQYNTILRAGFALAPVAYVSEIKSPIRLLAPYSDNIELLMRLFGVNVLLPQNALLRWLSKYLCEINHYDELICENTIFILCGYDEKQFNRTLLPMVLAHAPAGVSTKTLVHYAQEVKNHGRFQYFDYGFQGNIREYGSFEPPEYPLHKITLPIALLSAENDWLSSDVDVRNLYSQLANPIEHYVVPLKEFNHIDFLWAVDAPTLVYSKLLQLLEQDVSRPTG